ncbi:methyl-accepting chemotaxis protein [Bacillus sp. SORGH_AS 510]|uniref:hypothetical protein n=1 Tax=Bacillus sp. SORGH_AS_0510 TaxID=3041771 RepID=UPI00277DF1F0|nr:hypothetical protein [Bacillus sp. SORGH_AS_0510]MDQ1144026.1 methyl-accepting chemotaxis protein [Bacillus sp. SORGH_AS_0510]
MSKEVLTIIFGILSGVLVFVIGRFIEKLFIDPIKEHKSVIAEIYDGMIFYTNRITSPLHVTEDIPNSIIAEINKVSDEIRRLSTKLRAATYNLKGFYWLYRIFFRAPSLKDINEVCGSLIGISNGLLYRDNRHHVMDFNIKKHEIIMQKLKLNKFEHKLKRQ